jgi:hypothetical protein
MTDTPTTAAGRALVQSFREMAEHQAAGMAYIKPPARFISTGQEAIRAIEQEAVTRALDALTELVVTTPLGKVPSATVMRLIVQVRVAEQAKGAER